MIEFVDANIFIERWSNDKAKEFIDNLNPEKHCTSVLVLSEVYHKLVKRNPDSFTYLRTLMGRLEVFDFTQQDLFNAMKDPLEMNINDKIHIEVMKRNKVDTIVSFDKDFDKNKTIKRIEP